MRNRKSRRPWDALWSLSFPMPSKVAKHRGPTGLLSNIHCFALPFAVEAIRWILVGNKIWRFPATPKQTLIFEVSFNSATWSKSTLSMKRKHLELACESPKRFEEIWPNHPLWNVESTGCVCSGNSSPTPSSPSMVIDHSQFASAC